MISLETAKKLKDAGLKWDPNWGDYFAGSEEVEIAKSGSNDGQGFYKINYFGGYMQGNGIVWIPRLDQLLAEISKTEWKWVLFSTGGIFLENDEKGTWHEIECENNEANVEAAAQALLWILEQEGEKA
jgi:hypothetical protein